jgi:hypothetical protein
MDMYNEHGHVTWTSTLYVDVGPGHGHNENMKINSLIAAKLRF